MSTERAGRIAGDDLAARIARDGFALTQAAETTTLLTAHSLDPAAFPAFAESWNDLGLDRFMADGGRYRRRRFGCFAVTSDGVIRKPHQPHYQSRDYNTLNGGIERWFPPILDTTADNPVMRAAIAASQAIFGAVSGTHIWHAEAHQFRIEAHSGSAGRPTPEGMHRDGVDFVLVLLIARVNIASGTTRIEDIRHQALDSFTLTNPLDAAWVDDQRVYHAVTEVRPINPALPAYRDVLVLTFRRQDEPI